MEGEEGVGMSFTYNRNNIGLSELPWGTPKFNLIKGDVIPWSWKKIYLSEMKLLMNLIKIVGNLILIRE